MDIDPPQLMKLIMHFQVYNRFGLNVVRSLVSSKKCGIIETIFLRWKSRNAEMFSAAVPLFDITVHPGTFDILLCILSNK